MICSKGSFSNVFFNMLSKKWLQKKRVCLIANAPNVFKDIFEALPKDR